MPAAVGRCVGTSIFRHRDVGDVCDGRRWAAMGGVVHDSDKGLGGDC